uniref:Cilia- and flagella-associated protein 44 n=1 Tax=Macrostomum lignano TaxID=282301 RepID=A0A1I8JLC0_9PLAT
MSETAEDRQEDNDPQGSEPEVDAAAEQAAEAPSDAAPEAANSESDAPADAAETSDQAQAEEVEVSETAAEEVEVAEKAAVEEEIAADASAKNPSGEEAAPKEESEETSDEAPAEELLALEPQEEVIAAKPRGKPKRESEEPAEESGTGEEDAMADGTEAKAEGEGKVETEGEADDKAEGEAEGEGEAKGEGEAEGDGEAKGEGETEGEGEAEDEDKEVEKPSTPARRISPRDNEGEGGDETNSDNQPAEEDKPAIPADFFYEVGEFMSKPRVTEDSGLPADLLQLVYSYGYDCTKRDNLHILDEQHVCFVAGNLVKVVNLATKRQTFLRSSSGGGVGFVSVHPTRRYLAVAEKGEAPNVLVYEYPSLRLYRILRGGTERAYCYCKFDPSGKYLATVGSEPDFMLTIWDWLSERTVLRSKAFSQDVYRVSWSQDLEGFLTTAGTGHVRFWKMASTFTGLKLQGAIGKFGKTEISDIEGFVELPDGKVLSGCEWGNMLVWDGGLIKVEISKKGKRPAHNGPIFQVVMDAGELMTVGIDGLIQTWDFEMIDTAEAGDESGLIEMDPMNAYEVGNNVRLAHIVKQVTPADATTTAEDEGSSEWLAQDSNGGIWRLDLSFSHTAQPPERLLSCHAGAIAGCAASPLSYLVATLGADGSVRVTDFVAQRTLVESRFSGSGTKILWAPQTVDPKGRTILAGFADGVLRVLSFGENPETDPTRKAKQVAELTLVDALKPHTGRVVDIVLDKMGDMLVTAGIEHESSHAEEQLSSIFFFSVSASKYTPVGFIRFQGYPAQLAWLSSGSDQQPDQVRVFFTDGRVCDFDCPDPAKVDASVTYELAGFDVKQRFAFASVKSKLRRAEELEEIHRLEAEEMKRRAEERKRKLERGLQTEEEQAKEVEDEEKEIAKRRAEEQQWEPYYPEEPSPILCGLVPDNQQNAFWLSMGGFDSGYLYRCEYPAEAPKDFEAAKREPVHSVTVKDSSDVPVSVISFSKSGRRAYLGMQDGSVRVQLLDTPFDIGSMTSQWCLPMHDNDYGAVTGICPSHDDAYLISVGRDGNYFVYNIMPEEEMQERQAAAAKAKAAVLPSAKRIQRGDDIDDPGAYSIEEDKQKSEHDRRVKLAEEKKAGIRRRVNELRVEFRKLKELNQALPERIQLRQREFEMVPQLKLDMQEQRKQKVHLVERELAWESERCQIALNKLRKRFLDELECDLVVVRAIESDHEVASIRTSKLSEAFNRLKEEMERKRTLASQKDATRDATLLSAKEVTLEASAEKEEDSPLFKSNLKGARGERILRQLRKVEEKKRKRAQRRQERQELEQSKPSDDYDDPRTFAPSRRLAYQHKCDFNRRLVALRDRKKQLVQELNAKLQQLEAIQLRLRPDDRKPLPPKLTMHSTETPEKKYEYTQETLMEFKAEMEAKAAVAVTGEDDQGFSAFKKAAGISSLAPPGGAPGASSSQLTDAADAASVAGADKSTSALSELQSERLAAENLRNLYAQNQLLREFQSAVRNFDCEVRLLRHEKFDLDAKLKRAELRQITLFEEFQLLQQFEISESTLANRVEQRGEEKIDVQNKVVECTSKIESKKKDIERVQEKDRLLFDTFKESLGEGNKFTEYLTKVYRKRIKRKKVEKEGEDADEDDESDSDDDSDFESEEEESDGEGVRYDLDICPAGCDQNLYDNTCALREKRLDLEEELAEERKTMEALRKELEGLQKKARAVETALAQAEKELEAFQLEKQSKLNELETVVVLRLHQILHHENGHLPQDISNCLVFERSALLQLKRRISELQEEKHQQNKEQKDAKRKNIQLNKDRRLYQAHIDDMMVKCDKMMVDKFGKVEDMEKLEQIVVNPKIEELTVKMFEQQEKMLDEMNQWDDKIREAKDQLISQTRDNTKKLSQMLMLYTDQFELEEQIESRQKNLGSEYQGAREADIEEIEKLMQLVQIQAQELNALKEEIGMLSRKGGHILPPVQPPMQGPL